MSEKSIAETIRAEYDESAFPTDFLAGYDRMECLADSGGRDTFIVLKKDGGDKFIAKCFDKSVGSVVNESAILRELSHAGLPKYAESFENEAMAVAVREYIDGLPLDRYISENEPGDQQIMKLCAELADILIYLHGQTPPVIHRDIKPQNIIVKPDGHVALIGFDIPGFITTKRKRTRSSSGKGSTRRPNSTAFRRPTPAPTSTPSAFCCASCLPEAQRQTKTSDTTSPSCALCENAWPFRRRSAMPT